MDSEDENEHLFDLSSEQIDLFYKAHKLGDKNSTYFLLEVFALAVGKKRDVHPCLLEVVNDKIKLILDGSDARTVFPNPNKVGAPKKISLAKQFILARDVAAALQSKKVSNQLAAFEHVAEEYGVTEGVVENAVKSVKSLLKVNTMSDIQKILLSQNKS